MHTPRISSKGKNIYPAPDQNDKKKEPKKIDEKISQTTGKNLVTHSPSNLATKARKYSKKYSEDTSSSQEEHDLSQTLSQKSSETTSTQAKTEQKSKGWFARMRDYTTDRALGVLNQAIDVSLKWKVDKTIIQKAQRNIQKDLYDPQLINFIGALTPFLNAQIDKNLNASNSNNFLKTLSHHKKAIQDLGEVNLWQGFANLAKEVSKHRHEIESYDNQSSLVNIFIYLTKSASLHINQELLAEIAKSNPREAQSHIKQLLDGLYSDSTIRLQKEKLIEAYIHSSIDKKSFLKKMFEGQDISQETSAFLITQLDLCAEHHKKLFKVFDKVADALLVHLFPKKVNSLTLPGLANIVTYIPWLPNFLYNSLGKSVIIDSLLDLYKPIEHDQQRSTQDLKVITTKTESNLANISQVPATFLMGWIRNKIKTDPSIVGLIASIFSPLSDKETQDDLKVKRQLFNELSQEQLANWLLQSLQTLLDTNDPHMQGLGEFTKQFLNHLSLSLFAKGTKLVFPDNKQIPEYEFIKVWIERIIHEISTVKDEMEIKVFLNNFLEDIQLPNSIKETLLPFLSTQLTELNSKLVFATSNDEDLENEIRNYKEGDHILSLIDKFSDDMVEQILEKNLDLFDDADIDEKLDELLDIYLPNIKLETNLKNWLKVNISSLSSNEGINLKSVQLLKNGIESILKKSIINTIKTNFKDDKDYAAQLLRNIDNAFAISFSKFDENAKNQIIQGRLIRNHIFELNSEVKKLKQKKFTPANHLTTEQTTALADLRRTYRNYWRTIKNQQGLEHKLERTLAKLDPYWTQNFKELKDVLAYYAIDPIALQIPANKIALHHLTNQNPQDYQIIEHLLELKASDLKLLKEACHIDVIRTNVPDTESLKNDLEIQLQNLQDVAAPENFEEWVKAKETIKEEFNTKNEIERISLNIADLERSFDQFLPIFKDLSHELSKLIGLDQKEKLNLPPFLQDQIWPLIEEAKEEHISRLLFTHCTPLILVVSDIEENRKKLMNLTAGKFTTKIAHAVSNQAINQLGELITNYKPFAKTILQTLTESDTNLSETEVEKMDLLLQQTMIELGNKNITKETFKPFLEDFFETSSLEKSSADTIERLKQENTQKKIDFSEALYALTRYNDFVQFDSEQIFELTKIFIVPRNKKEETKVRRKALLLSKELNYQLIARGKNKLTPSILVNRYQNLLGTQFSAEEIKEKTTLLRRTHVVQKIKNVVITPEEMAENLERFIPGANDLHALISSELQNLISGQDKTLTEHRRLIGLYIEGMFLRMSLKIAEANYVPGRDTLEVLTEKLKNMIPTGKIEGHPEDIAKQITDRFLEDLGGLKSSADFKGVPLPLQDFVYKTLKEVSYKYLTPVIIPIVEVEASRSHLDSISGSQRFSKIGAGLINYAMQMIPEKINNYQSIARKIYSTFNQDEITTPELIQKISLEIEHLVNQKSLNFQLTKLIDDDPELVNDLLQIIKDSFLDEKLRKNILRLVPDKNLAYKIFKLAKDIPQVEITESMLVESYLKATNQFANREELEKLESLLVQTSIKKDLDQIIITPYGIAELIRNKVLPFAPEELRDTIASAIEFFIHDREHLLLNNTTEFASRYIEATLFKLFIKISEKNPPKDGKDSFVVMTENILTMVEKTYQEARKKPFDVVANNFGDNVLKGVLGLDSPDALEGIPPDLQEMVYSSIKTQLSGRLQRYHQGLQKLDSSNPDIKGTREKLVAFGTDKRNKAYAETLVDDAGRFILGSLLNFLPDLKKDKYIDQIFNKISDSLDNLAQTHQDLAELLSDFVKPPALKTALKNALDKFVDANPIAENKQKAASLIGNVILNPLSQFLDKAFNFEKNLDDRAVKFDRTLVTNLLNVAVDHIKIKNEAKEIARRNNRERVSYEDLVEAAKNKLPAGMPLTADIHQKETAKIVDELEKEIFKPDADIVVKLVFPNGQQDLFFLPPEDRQTAWQLIESLKPSLVPILMESINFEMITQMFTSALVATSNNLDEKISLPSNDKKPIGGPLDALDEVSGELLLQLMKNVKLPDFIKNKILDGQGVTPDMKRMLGSTLRDQFNGRFIETLIPKVLESLTERNKKTGDYALKVKPKANLTPQQIEKQKRKLEAELKKSSRRVVSSAISNVIRTQWAVFQKKFDQAVSFIFGNMGLEFKNIVDVIARFIFFTIIGKVLSVIFWPITRLVKEVIYRVVSLDYNVTNVVDIFRDVLDDQPFTQAYGINNISLFHNFVQSAYQTFQEFSSELE